MDVRTLCLGILSYGDASGYEIKKAIEEHFGYFLDVSHGSIYPALAALLKEDLVSCTEVPQQGKPDKKVYSLTARGRDAFAEGLLRSPGRHRMRSEFLPLLLFAGYLPPERVKALLDERVAEMEQHQVLAESVLSDCSGEQPSPGLRFAAEMQLAAMKAAREYIESNRQWLEAALEAAPNEPSEAAK